MWISISYWFWQPWNCWALQINEWVTAYPLLYSAGPSFFPHVFHPHVFCLFSLSSGLGNHWTMLCLGTLFYLLHLYLVLFWNSSQDVYGIILFYPCIDNYSLLVHKEWRLRPGGSGLFKATSELTAEVCVIHFHLQTLTQCICITTMQHWFQGSLSEQ